jgi:hypothetical protein
MYGEEGGLWRRVDNYVNGSADSLAGWTWSFSLPTGCSAIAIGGGFNMSLDVCQWQSMIHDLMSIAWILATIGGLFRIYMWGVQ